MERMTDKLAGVDTGARLMKKYRPLLLVRLCVRLTLSVDIAEICAKESVSCMKLFPVAVVVIAFALLACGKDLSQADLRARRAYMAQLDRRVRKASRAFQVLRGKPERRDLKGLKAHLNQKGIKATRERRDRQGQPALREKRGRWVQQVRRAWQLHLQRRRMFQSQRRAVFVR